VRWWRIYGSTLSLLVCSFRAGRLPLVSLSSGPRLLALSSPPRLPTPAVSPPISTMPLLPAPLALHLGCRQAITAPISSPSSNHALTRRNEPNYSAIEAPPLASRYPAFTVPAPLSRPYKSHPDDPWSIPHLIELLSSALPRRNSSPPSFPDHHRSAASPCCHTAARAPVRPEPSSPLSVAPPPVSFGASEWLEAILR
jgi:hypothetical protein